MILTCDRSGERLDAFLSRALPEISRSAAQKLIAEGNVLLDGKPAKKNDRLEHGQTVSVTIPEPKPVDVTPTEMQLDIVYEDEDVAVINKPKGLVVHPAAGHQDDTLVNGLLYAMGDSLSGINGELRPGIVHRIDKDTSGLLAIAKNDLAHAVLASQLKDHTMARTYEAIVCGNLKEDSGTVDAPIGRHPTDRKKMCVTQRNSKPAVTHWEVVKRYRGYTHIRCHMETGRTHASIWPTSATPFWGTRFTATRSRSWARTANVSTPGLCPFATRETADPSWSLPHCQRILPRCWRNWKKWGKK